MKRCLKNIMKFSKTSATLSKREFDSKPVYINKYLKNKLNSYNGKINTNFHNNKKSKECFQYICQSVILIDSVYRKDKDYYLLLFWEECKCVVKEKKTS